MRNIVSPLSGFASPFGQLRGGTSPLALYAANGITPQLVADFKSGTYGKASALSTFDGLLEHSRASSATYVDSSGVLQTAASGVARENHHVYNGSAWVKEGYLHEPEAATNLVTYSQDFTDSSWLAQAATKTSANVFTATATSNIHALVAVFSTTSGEAYTYQQKLTYDNNQFVSLRIAAGIFPHVCFDLINGTIAGTETGASGTITDIGNDEFLCSITVTATSTGTGNAGVFLQPSATNFGNAWLAAGTERVIAKHAQLEVGSVPTSYIPTSGSQVTRAADILTLPIENIPYPTGDNLAVSFGYKALVTYADTGSGNEFRFMQWGSGGDPTISLYGRTSGARTGNIITQQVDAVTTEIDGPATSYSPGINVPMSVATRHGSTFLNLAVDGTALTADTTPTAFPDLSATDLVIAPNGGPQVIQEFIMWGGETGDIGDAGIEETSA